MQRLRVLHHQILELTVSSASLGVFCHLTSRVVFGCMKKTNASRDVVAARSGARLLRRLVRRMFSSWIKRRSCHCQDNRKALLAKLRELEEVIDIIAPEIVRQKRLRRRYEPNNR